MDTTDQTQTQIASNYPRPIRDSIIDQINANAVALKSGLLPYASEVFKFEAAPIDKARVVLGMCMSAELGGDKDRKKFLMLVFGFDGTSQLDHTSLSALWHWVKPFIGEKVVSDQTRACWFANEDRGAIMRKAILEDINGTWEDNDGQPTLAAW